jgi:aspartate racemase
MHRVAETVEENVDIPLIHIADASAHAIQRTPSRRPALLATRFTMEQDFCKGRLRSRYGLDIVVPEEEGRERIHRIIYDELCRGTVLADSKTTYLNEIARLRTNGADGVILGCTEIMLISQEDVDMPVFDTTRIHAESAYHFATTTADRGAP